MVPEAREELRYQAGDLRRRAEEQIRNRLLAIEQHMRQKGASFDSLDEIYLTGDVNL